MTAAPARLAPAEVAGSGLDEAVVTGAEIVAGHDGAAELLVRLKHGNGAASTITLDPASGFDLLRAAGADALSALVGRPWRALIKDL